MTETLLQGIRVVDLAGEPLAMTGRILADLGAEVIKLEPVGGDALRRVLPLDETSGESLRFQAWNAGKISIECSADNLAQIENIIRNADVVIETPGFPGSLQFSPDLAPQAVWLKATPFGLDGPRASWIATDLGIMAASGNLYVTGDPDRPPVHCTEPASYAHAAAEAVFAILTALASGRPQIIDLSCQEAVMIANMGGVSGYHKNQNRGKRMGANIGVTREIWPCKDGFVSFGLRGGRARVGNFKILLAQLEKENFATSAWREQDWDNFDPAALTAAALQAIEAPLFHYFAAHTMTELYELAAQTNLMLASANTPKEIFASAQIMAREMFGPLGRYRRFPQRFMTVRSPDNSLRQPEPVAPAPLLNQGPLPSWERLNNLPNNSTIPLKTSPAQKGAWSGLKLVEFGAGAAGPIASRYFAEQGATVIKVESRSRPEFLRMMAINSPHGLEGSNLFDALNVGKRSITINLKNPQGIAIARRLILWADAVQENFAPKAMQGFGLDYASLVQTKPDLVMISTCLNGQTGPHKNYPGFGSQGAALSGYNYLTGWPDREPVGPYGTITDSLAPRFAASALAAGLLYRRRTGKGVYLDLSQVEAAIYTLAPWLLDYSVNGRCTKRLGNRSLHTAPHGVFPASGEDCWVAIATWNDQQWQHLAEFIQLDAALYPTLTMRFDNQDVIEQAISGWTKQYSADGIAEMLQAKGIEAVPVANFADLYLADKQLQQRQHFLQYTRPITGISVYERNGFRLSDSPAGFACHAPTLGENTDEILTHMLGYSSEDVAQFRNNGAIE